MNHMDSNDATAEAEFEAIKWKPNDKTGQRLPADYIMRHDPDARRAYQEMRYRLGLSHAEAELRIERLSDANFRTALFSRAEEDLTDKELADPLPDRRPEMWVQLARGFTVEQIFANLEDLGMIPEGRRLQ